MSKGEARPAGHYSPWPEAGAGDDAAEMEADLAKVERRALPDLPVLNSLRARRDRSPIKARRFLTHPPRAQAGLQGRERGPEPFPAGGDVPDGFSLMGMGVARGAALAAASGAGNGQNEEPRLRGGRWAAQGQLQGPRKVPFQKLEARGPRAQPHSLYIEAFIKSSEGRAQAELVMTGGAPPRRAQGVVRGRPRAGLADSPNTTDSAGERPGWAPAMPERVSPTVLAMGKAISAGRASPRLPNSRERAGSSELGPAAARAHQARQAHQAAHPQAHPPTQPLAQPLAQPVIHSLAPQPASQQTQQVPRAAPFTAGKSGILLLSTRRPAARLQEVPTLPSILALPVLSESQPRPPEPHDPQAAGALDGPDAPRPLGLAPPDATEDFAEGRSGSVPGAPGAPVAPVAPAAQGDTPAAITEEMRPVVRISME